MALGLYLSTALLEPLDRTVVSFDVHKALRKSFQQHKWNQPVSFLQTGNGSFLVAAFAEVTATQKGSLG